jgi:cytochrome oxidase Cu insertion factor (SCO1/SenC/PrrC family)
MLDKFRLISLLSITVLLLAACSSAAPTPETATPQEPATTETIMDKGDENMADGNQDDNTMEEKSPDAAMPEDTPEPMQEDKDKMDESSTPAADSTKTEMEETEAMAVAPAWFSVALTNVANGESFTIADLKGKVVLVENMAVWCSTCLRQQKQVKALQDLLGERDDFVSLGLDIDPNEDAALLKGYIESNGFDWTYAVVPVEVGREIGQLYGDQFLNPPSTPMFIIDRKGQTHPLPFGVKSAAELQKALEPFLSEAI